MPVLALLWVAWGLSWLLASQWTAKTVARQSPGSLIVQSLPIWIGGLLIFRVPTGVLATPLFRSPSWMRTATIVLALLGFAITWWARITLGRLWSSAVTLKAEHTLIRSGPYAMTRHPIYTGLLLAVLATALNRDTSAALLGFGLITIGLVIKLRQEERFMTGRFGAAYNAYRNEVPALIPGVRWP